MGKIKNALIRFMYGRNGADKLGQVMLWVYLGIMVL